MATLRAGSSAVTTGTSSATLNVTIPSGTVVGDTVLIWPTMGFQTITFSATGFTAQTATSTTFASCQLLSRVMDGTEGWTPGTTTVTVTASASHSWNAVICAVGDTAGFDPALSGSGQINASSTTLSVPGVTTTAANDLLVWFGFEQFGSGVTPAIEITVPSGFTAAVTEVLSSGVNTSNIGTLFATHTQAAAGATGNEDGSISTARVNGGLVVSFAPAAAGAPGYAQPGKTWLRRFHHRQQPPPAPVPVPAVNVTAGVATASAVATLAVIAEAVNTAASPAAGTAPQPIAAIAVNAAVAAAAGVAPGATVPGGTFANAGVAVASGTAMSPTFPGQTSVNAGVASASAVALAAAVTGIITGGRPPPLSPAIRYFPPGLRRVYWVPALVNYQAPTRGELNAGTDLSAEIAGMDGWTVTAKVADHADIPSRFVAQVPVPGGMVASSVSCYTSQNSGDVRSLLTRWATGYVVCLWEGDVPGRRMDVFPVRVTDLAVGTGEDAGQVTVSFAGWLIPATAVVIPA